MYNLSAMHRYLEQQIRDDLSEKMVFLGGPRQVGKTTLAKTLLGKREGYLNWDIDDDRTRILERELPDSNLLVLDEIHKYRRWRNFLKGLYDGKNSSQQILVTGSARLDLYRFGGDSLQGRYFYLRLHPLSVAEVDADPEAFRALFRWGGFPEPFLKGSDTFAARWLRDYKTRLVRDDVASLERVLDLASLEVLMNRLPEHVGSILSINSLAELLQVSPRTMTKWVDILERTYAIFRLSLFTSRSTRSLRKSRKHYHFNWNAVPENGPRFENMVACHLLKWVHYRQDTLGEDTELQYFRDTDGREVDFVIVRDRKPIQFIECKYADPTPSKSLRYVKRKFPAAEAFQLYFEGRKEFVTEDGVHIQSALKFLRTLI